MKPEPATRSRTDDETEDLARSGLPGDTGARVDGDPADVAGRELLDLAGVDAGPDLEPDAPTASTIALARADRPRRSVEHGEEAVAGRVDLAAAEARQLGSDRRVMALEQLPPAAVAELRRELRRADDVREQDGRQDAIRLVRLRAIP